MRISLGPDLQMGSTRVRGREGTQVAALFRLIALDIRATTASDETQRAVTKLVRRNQRLRRVQFGIAPIFSQYVRDVSG